MTACQTNSASARFAALAIVSSLLGACAGTRLAQNYDCVVRVSSDPGRPLAGAQLLVNGSVIGTTGDLGSAKLRFVGTEGEHRKIEIRCPDGYRSPEAPVTVSLRHLALAGPMPEFDASCPPENRTVVVAIRADKGADLPVLYLGEELARTDRSGAAHVSLSLPAGSQFELTLETDSESTAQLRPRNPARKFQLGDSDEVFLFDQPFVPPEPVQHHYTRAAPSGPIRLH
jgi:hypothetical protein